MDDIQSQTAQTSKPISDDQELAKVLAGISKEADDIANSNKPATPPIPPMPPLPDMPLTTTLKSEDKPMPDLKMPDLKMPDFNSMTPSMPPKPMDKNLDGIRKDALLELRPLVDKLDLAAEEKFDIYLLLLRSTDDTTLIAPAHEAAKKITDEEKRAEALLDIIKEIDFLSAPAHTE